MTGQVRPLPTLAAGVHGLAWAWLCLCALPAGCAELPATAGIPPPSFVPSGASHPAFEIGVLVAGWHTGIVLPAGELGPLQALLRSDSEAKYLSFGWGSRRFYMSAHPGSGDAIAALFRSPSVLFVQPAAAPADLLASDVHIHWVCASREQLWRVDHYIEQSLSRPGNPVDLGHGPFAGSRFYASTGRYSAVHTCNTWTVAALEYAGLPVKASGVLFSSQADRRIRTLRACPARQ